MIKLHDRVKEKVYTIGTGNFALSGVFSGFVSFSSVYQNGDSFFYVANDGSRYEIGSGVYISSSNEIQRFPIKSSNSNNKVNFPEGLKEVYVNYPATNSVFNGSGIDVLPVNSGLAFWTSSNSLSSDNNFYIDSGNHRIGLNQPSPIVAIDVGGSLEYSKIRSSGFIVGKSGIYFPPNNDGDADYLGGQQLVHFEKNQLDLFPYDQQLVDEYTGLANIIQLSGNVNQYFLLQKQNVGMFFAGPVSGCSPPCEPNYPVFRYIEKSDIPDLSDKYITYDYVYNGVPSIGVKLNGITYGEDTISLSTYDGNLNLTNGSSWNFDIKLSALSSGLNTSNMRGAAWNFKGLAYRPAHPESSDPILFNDIIIESFVPDELSGINAYLQIDSEVNSMQVNVTGKGEEVIKWSGVANLVQCFF
jgi:hypothetical protein